MTGYDEARGWLQAFAPEWRLRHGRAILKAGPTIGAPISEWIEVELVESSGAFTVTLDGEGESYLKAVQNAVGGLRNV